VTGDEVTPGSRAYQAYGDHVGWRDIHGSPMPHWKLLPSSHRQGFEKAARTAMVTARRIARTGQLKTHFNAPGDVHTLCGLVRGGLLATTDEGAVTCGRCQRGLRIRKGLHVSRNP
jgi:hypothetical protein